MPGSANYSRLREDDLVAALQSGESEAGGEIYRRYHTRIEAFCVRLTGSRSSGQDAAHETFIAMLDHVGDLRDQASFRSWLFRIARNECLMALRSTSEHVSLDDAGEVWDESSPLTLTLDRELNQMVGDAIQRLRSSFRVVILLRDFESLSYREIAEATESSVAAVKFRLHKARKALATALGEYLDKRSHP